jgi:hypothetical protein
MKKFIIINGTRAVIFMSEDMPHARETAVNTSNHSLPISVYELTKIEDFTRVNETEVSQKFT